MLQTNSDTAVSVGGAMATATNAAMNGMISSKGIGNGPILIEKGIEKRRSVDMERLTIRDETGIAIACREGCMGGPACFDCERQVAERLADIEDALGDEYDLKHVHELAQAENDGRLVVLPCKVGDTVYVTYGEGYKLHVVDRVYITGNQEVQVRMRNPSTVLETLRLSASNFGKTVFLTRQEAEEAMREEDSSGK